MTNYAEDEGISFSDVVNELHYLHMLLKSDIDDIIDIIESQEENRKVINDE